jgi:hypothetical protein
MSFSSPAACLLTDPHVGGRRRSAARFAAVFPDVAGSVANGFSLLNRELFINSSNKTNKDFNGW